MNLSRPPRRWTRCCGNNTSGMNVSILSLPWDNDLRVEFERASPIYF